VAQPDTANGGMFVVCSPMKTVSVFIACPDECCVAYCNHGMPVDSDLPI
jgi:hypothetical protein